ncbi:MAG: type II/IV secretion system protein [Bacilli bacterium]|nr:type II/IV secretion system protein [Bacilli bacterium]
MFREFDYDNKPIVDIVNEMIIDAVKNGGSDIHFDPTEDELMVRIRVDGSLLEYAKVPATVKKNLITRIKIISGMNITETRLPQDGAIKGLIENMDVDLRVSSLPIVDGEKVVIRILDYRMSLNGLESIGLTKDNFTKINELIKKPNGIIMITGATGSGKSTTVYSMLQVLNTTDRNIITVEDPVEMKIAGINQVQVMSEIGLTFGSSLRSILRQDPDIIMIGEIRDDETARIAVRASITGHLVLSTIHTNNSLNTIERLLDMDVERYLLGSALSGIISQRLVKKLCPKCRSARPTNSYEKNLFKKVLNMDVQQIYTPVGCPECINGYKGRIAVHEVLEITQEIRDAIVSNLRKEDLRRLVYGKDGSTLLKDGLIKVMEGFTSMDEIVRVIDVNDDFGEDDQELKDAIIGKTSKQTNNQNVANPFIKPNIETL